MPDPIAQEILSSRYFSALESVIEAKGIRNLNPLSGGVSSVVLQFDDKVLRMGLGTLVLRPLLPEVLQATDCGEVGSLRFEVLPKVDTDSVDLKDVVAVSTALAERGYAWGDAGVDNVGRHNERLVVFDPDGLAPIATSPTATSHV